MWCGDITLKKAFPDLYCLSRVRDSSVAEVMCWSSGRIHWNFQFCSTPQDWEEDSFDQFIDTVYSSKVRRVGPNKVCWKPTRSRGFEVRGFFLSTLLLFPSHGGWCGNQKFLQGWLPFHGQLI